MKTKAMMAIAALLTVTLLTGMATACERMTVSTDKETYGFGEDVTIEIVNQGKEPALLKGYWVEDSDEQVIYNPPMLTVEEYLEPGESRRYVWTQIGDFGVQVPAGIYTINIEESGARIEIPPDPLVLSTDKEAYESGEDVVITLTNEGDEAVTISSGYIMNEKGEIVHAPDVLACEFILQPGESAQYTWDQIADDGRLVPEGDYTICSGNIHSTITIVPETQCEITEDAQCGIRGRRPDIVPKPPLPGPKARKLF